MDKVSLYLANLSATCEIGTCSNCNMILLKLSMDWNSNKSREVVVSI